MREKNNKDAEIIEEIVIEKQRRDEELNSVLAEIGIKVLRYKEHKDWTEWFGKIRRLRRESRSVK